MRQREWQRGRILNGLGLLAAAALASFAGAATAADGPSLEYNRDIRPILAENCFACHGPDSAARKADLRLDRREAAIEAGAIVAREPESSELIARINAKDPKELMPPPKTTKTLTAQRERDPAALDRRGRRLSAALVADTAEAARPAEGQGRVVGPQPDRPVRAGEARGERPASRPRGRPPHARPSPEPRPHRPAASPRARRSVRQDPSPEAYEDLVTRLLDSPRWGEHRARYWLDAARYADTNGYHFDNYREAWAYRDWVIGAFNRNLPFDRFTIEQLAGDLLPGHTLDQQVASGFNRCNATTNEGGVIPEEYKVLYARDRTETTSLVWMGLTAGCAVCHDHKFDPITQREFYELSAFFNNTTQPTMDGNVKDTPPTVFVPAAADRRRWESLSAELSDARGKLAARKSSARPDFDRWLAAAKPDELAASVPAEGLRLATNAPAPGAWPVSRFEVGRCRRLREGPGVLLRRLDQAAEAGDDRLGPGADGHHRRLPRLGPLARGEPRRHPHPPQVARRRAQGRRARRGPGERLDPRARHLRRLGQGRRGEDLHQRRAPGDRRRRRRPEAHDPHHGPAQGRPAAHSGTARTAWRSSA